MDDASRAEPSELSLEQLQQALEEARQRNSLLETVLQGVTDGITMQDRAGRLLFANEVGAQLSGYPTSKALLAAAPDEVINRFELRDGDGNLMSAMDLPGRQALQGEHPPPMELRFRPLPDGKERWSIVRATPVFDEHGEVQAAINVFHDVTDRKRAEQERTELLQREQAARAQAELTQQQLSFLAEASNILASSLDYESTLGNVARLAVPHLGDWCVVHIAEPTGALRPLAVAHVDPEKVAWAEALQQHLLPLFDAPAGINRVAGTGKPVLIPHVRQESLDQIAADPQQRAILRELAPGSVIIVPLIAHGKTLGTFTLVSAESGKTYTEDDLNLVMDLARRAAIAVDNARLYEEAQTAIQLRERILSITSHELRAPLTSILGYTQLLTRPDLRSSIGSERVQRALDTIAEQSHRLDRLIDVLLDFSRLQTGRLTLERAPVDLASLTRGLVEETSASVQHHTIELSCPESPLMIDGDEVRLAQVLQNLIDNAIKYSPGGGRVEVRLLEQEENVVVEVADDGIGIPDEAIPHLFESFYRADNADTTSTQGLGLGLFIVKESIALHGGQVEVTSQSGQGSTFTIYLPRESP